MKRIVSRAVPLMVALAGFAVVAVGSDRGAREQEVSGGQAALVRPAAATGERGALASAPTPDVLVSADEKPNYDGAALYKTWCASCHGVAADGTGPLAPQMRRRVPDLTQIAEKNGGMFPTARIRRIIDGRDVGAHGNPDMPVWGNTFKTTKDGDSEASVRARIEAIVHYLETIQRRNAQ